MVSAAWFCICYLAAEQAGKELFHFRPQQMSYELLYRETFAEILCPETVYDLIDYHLRECLKRGIKMRVCKNCGRLFAVTGHGGTEYCDRPFDEKGRTCKEIGAFRVWEKSKSGDEVFKAYRREYKKRFAWIRSGRLAQEEFYAWSEKARGKKRSVRQARFPLMNLPNGWRIAKQESRAAMRRAAGRPAAITERFVYGVL